MNRGCEYFKAVDAKDKICNCATCKEWTGARCRIEDKIKRIGALMQAPFNPNCHRTQSGYRSNGNRVFK